MVVDTEIGDLGVFNTVLIECILSTISYIFISYMYMYTANRTIEPYEVKCCFEIHVSYAVVICLYRYIHYEVMCIGYHPSFYDIGNVISEYTSGRHSDVSCQAIRHPFHKSDQLERSVASLSPYNWCK